MTLSTHNPNERAPQENLTGEPTVAWTTPVFPDRLIYWTAKYLVVLLMSIERAYRAHRLTR